MAPAYMDCFTAFAMTGRRHREAAGRGDPCIQGGMDCFTALAMTGEMDTSEAAIAMTLRWTTALAIA